MRAYARGLNHAATGVWAVSWGRLGGFEYIRPSFVLVAAFNVNTVTLLG